MSREGYFLPADKLNEPMKETLDLLIKRARMGRWTDVRLRIEGEHEWYQSDWIQYLEPTTHNTEGE